MNRIRRIRRSAAVLAGLACAWLGLAAAAPAAFASVPHYPPAAPGPATTIAKLVPGPLPGDVGPGVATMVARPGAIPGTEFRPSAPLPAPVRAVTHTVVVSGMPGWQIALIAAGAALLGAAVAILAYRARAARRPATAAA